MTIIQLDNERQQWAEIWLGLVKAAETIPNETMAARMDELADKIQIDAELTFVDLLDIQENYRRVEAAGSE